MLENTARPSQPPPPAAHRHVQETDLPQEQLYSVESVPKARLAGCALAFCLAGWMLAVPVALVDRLKDSPGPAAGILSVMIVACAVATAGLSGYRFFNPRNRATAVRWSLPAVLAASVVAGAASAALPAFGMLLLVPCVVAGVPALAMLIRDATLN